LDIVILGIQRLIFLFWDLFHIKFQKLISIVYEFDLSAIFINTFVVKEAIIFGGFSQLSRGPISQPFSSGVARGA
jgi:hypothetical protein